MASRSTRRVLGVLGIAYSIGRTIAESSTTHFEKQYGKQIEMTSMAAMAFWPGALTDADIKQIGSKIDLLDICGFGWQTNTLESAAFLLDQIVCVSAVLKDPKRKEAIEKVYRAVDKWHRFAAPVDPTPSAEKQYEMGAKYSALFQEMSA